MFCTAWVAPDIWNPLANPAVGAQGDKSLVRLAERSPRSRSCATSSRAPPTKAKKKALAEAIQARAFEIGTHAPLGEYVNPLAARKSVTGFVTGPGNLYWNIKKN